jgi:hypothetical protein
LPEPLGDTRGRLPVRGACDRADLDALSDSMAHFGATSAACSAGHKTFSEFAAIARRGWLHLLFGGRR